MYGSWIINLCISVLMFLFYLLLSFSTDYWMKPLYESLIVGLIFFILTYFFRWCIASFIGDAEDNNLKIEQETVTNIQEIATTENTAIERTEQMGTNEIDQTTRIIKELLQD